jgi:steroid delta-isomerase-like uncharacterized protein
MQYDNAQILHSFYSAINDGNLEKAVSYFSENGEFRVMAFQDPARGTKEIRQALQDWILAFPDLKLEAGEIAASGNFAAAEVTLKATHQGTFRAPDGEISPTNRSVQVPSCDMARFSNGRITAFHCYMDSATLLRQLGVKAWRSAA